MIDILNQCKSKKLENLGTFFDSHSTIIVNKKIDETLSILHNANTNLNNEITIKVDSKGCFELIQIIDDTKSNILNNIECFGNMTHMIIVKENYKGTIENKVEVKDNGLYKCVFLDFSKQSTTISNNLNCLDSNELRLYFGSVVYGDNNKKVTNNLFNKSNDSSCYMDNYGISFDNGKLIINGNGHICKGATRSKNVQKATMFVMDNSSKATCEPCLYIDEDDVVASHANAVGQVSEETLFYLLSRGINLAMAKKMIVLGYFKEYIKQLNNKESKEFVDNYIKEVIDNV